jgi:chromosome segregation ATPase
MVDTPKDNNLEVEARRKELDSLIQKYKNDVHSLVQKLTNLPHYECTNSYNTLTTQDSHTVGKPKICPKELPVCSNYKANVEMGTCTNSDINIEINSINESENQIKQKLDEIHNYNSVNIREYNNSEADLKNSHATLVKDITDLKESKKQLKNAVEYHDNLTGKNNSLKLRITSNYIKYILWIILLIITIIITVLSFIDSNLVPIEVVMIYVFFVCIVAFISSPYFYLN